jgi:hypothetical protein
MHRAVAAQSACPFIGARTANKVSVPLSGRSKQSVCPSVGTQQAKCLSLCRDVLFLFCLLNHLNYGRCYGSCLLVAVGGVPDGGVGAGGQRDWEKGLSCWRKGTRVRGERVRGGRGRGESCRLRKVRTPQGSVLGVKLRQRAAQALVDGQCHREHTATVAARLRW